MPGSINLGDVVPDFEAETSMGPIKFHEWIGDRSPPSRLGRALFVGTRSTCIMREDLPSFRGEPAAARETHSPRSCAVLAASFCTMRER